MPNTKSLQAIQPLPFNLRTGTEIRNKPAAPPVCLIDPFFVEDGLLFVAALMKAGKSYLTLQLAMSIAGGCDFLGFKNTGGARKVAIIYGEMSRSEVETRFLAMLQAFPETAHDTICANFSYEMLYGSDISDPQVAATVIIKLRHAQTKVIVFDPYADFNSGDENEISVGKKLMKIFERIRQEVGAAAIIVHHSAKAFKLADCTTYFQAIRGTGVLGGKANAVLALEKCKDGTVMVGVEAREMPAQRLLHTSRNELNASFEKIQELNTDQLTVSKPDSKKQRWDGFKKKHMDAASRDTWQERLVTEDLCIKASARTLFTRRVATGWFEQLGEDDWQIRKDMA